jgi:hypothetical protein
MTPRLKKCVCLRRMFSYSTRMLDNDYDYDHDNDNEPLGISVPLH